MRRKQIGAAAVFLIALIFLGVNIAAVADDLVGEARSLSVLSVSGDEAVVMRGANREIKAAAGMPLGQGTKAKTGAGTNMYLQADEDKTIKMGSSTLVEITKASAKKLGITLKSGEIFFNVEQKLADDEEMIFHAAQTSLSIRGTSGFLIQEPGGETTLFLLEGMVEWSAGEETITLEAGQTGTYVPARDMRGDSLKNEGDFQWEDLDAFCLETLLNDISGIELGDFGLTSDQIPEALKRVQELDQEAREQEAILQSQAESFAQENSPGPDRDGLIVGGREPAEEDGGDNDKEIPIEDDRTEAEPTKEETTEAEPTEEETTEAEPTEEETTEAEPTEEEPTEAEPTEEETTEEESTEETTEEETSEEEPTEEETTEEETEPVPAPEIIGNAYGYVVDKTYVGEIQADGSEVNASIPWDYWSVLTERGDGTYWLVEHTGNIYAWTESECNSYGLYPTP